MCGCLTTTRGLLFALSSDASDISGAMTRAAIGRGRLGGCAAVLVSLLALVSVGSGAAASTVRVWFLQGEQMVPVERSGSTAADAVTALLQGPTAAERGRGLRTYVPAGVKLNGVTVTNGVARVDLTLKFALGT